MANKTISELPAVTTPTATDMIPIVQAGVTSKITYAVLAAAIAAGAAIYTETLTDSGDHQNFTALHTITTIYTLATLNGQYIASKNYSKAGSTITLTSADANIAAAGLELVYS